MIGATHALRYVCDEWVDRARDLFDGELLSVDEAIRRARAKDYPLEEVAHAMGLSGYGSGYGSGSVSGYGYGDGYGAGDGDGYGSGYGYGHGDGHGYGYGYGYGFGAGHGYGHGAGS